MAQQLRRSAPFLMPAQNGDQAAVLVDTVAVSPARSSGHPLLRRVAESLDLGRVADGFGSELAIEIVGDQYAACMDYMYSHPVWAGFRRGDNRRAVAAYLLESRQYLHAAASRMAPGPARSRSATTARVLAEHVVEEADHAVFFENGLAELGCNRATIQACRPAPCTFEWVHLMRSFAGKGALTAGVCSGLMESTAADKQAVTGWHSMVVENGLLPQAAVTAIYEHIKLDMELGHGGNWREVIESEAPIPARELHAALNAVCTVSEMLYRWFGSLESGLSSEAIELAKVVTARPPDPPLGSIDATFNALPVWPAEVLHQAFYGAEEPEGARSVVALAYHYDDRVAEIDPGLDDFQRAAASMPRERSADGEPASLEGTARSWMPAIEGHRLWSELTESPSVPLVFGWILENYHYLSAAVGHVSAAIAACPDPQVREVLVRHLEDEANHGEILRRGLESSQPDVDADASRPLPTTVAFLGCLHDLATSDWKAYCVALGFLQFSLSPGDSRHQGFYGALVGRCPEARALADAMRSHDSIDISDDHEASVRRLLELVESRHAVDRVSIGRASLVPQLAWSFLDGIRTHYCNGHLAVAQRLGWATRD
jgi:pyrroloquinoline quinone (PQQ) biosynthesis protein C